MYNGITISLKTILWKVLRFPLAAELTYEEAAEHAVEALRLLGAPLSLVDEVTNPPLQIVNHKAALPSNLLQIRGIRLINNTENYDNGGIALRYATDIYHQNGSCDIDGNESPYEYTYTVQKGIIFTSVPDGYVQVSYKALPVDEEGYPLIPDDAKTIMAMEYYILHRYLEPLWIMGKITDKAFNYVDQKRSFYMGGAGTSLQLRGTDHFESIMNTINRLIINDGAFKAFYKGTGEQERIKRY